MLLRVTYVFQCACLILCVHPVVPPALSCSWVWEDGLGPVVLCSRPLLCPPAVVWCHSGTGSAGEQGEVEEGSVACLRDNMHISHR